jgi:hypothetical protein
MDEVLSEEDELVELADMLLRVGLSPSKMLGVREPWLVPCMFLLSSLFNIS